MFSKDGQRHKMAKDNFFEVLTRTPRQTVVKNWLDFGYKLVLNELKLAAEVNWLRCRNLLILFFSGTSLHHCIWIECKILMLIHQLKPWDILHQILVWAVLCVCYIKFGWHVMLFQFQMLWCSRKYRKRCHWPNKLGNLVIIW